MDVATLMRQCCILLHVAVAASWFESKKLPRDGMIEPPAHRIWTCWILVDRPPLTGEGDIWRVEDPPIWCQTWADPRFETRQSRDGGFCWAPRLVANLIMMS